MRSETSLIQTIGRAARNVDGKVILYADKVTKSINKAIEETDRRRNKQLEFNKKNKITAETIKKDINDILESVYEKDYVKISEGSNVGGNLKKHLKALNRKMKEAASNLEFEEAAKIRDEMRKLEASELEITLNPKISQYKLKNKVYLKDDQLWVCQVLNLGKRLRNGSQKNNNNRWCNESRQINRSRAGKL